MKTKVNLFNLCPGLGVIVVIGLTMVTTLQAAPNPPPYVVQSQSSILRGVPVYSIRFPGGRISDFFAFMRTNGFAGDTILLAGNAGRVHIPEFTVSSVQLKEVAKSLEFVAESKIIVELVESPLAGDANVWRIKLVDRMSSNQIKTKACAVPNILTGDKARDRVWNIVKEVSYALAEGTEILYRDQSSRPEGGIRILESEKVVVAVGEEAYVEAVISALEAAEKVAASPK
jgi:hypothetical protein